MRRQDALKCNGIFLKILNPSKQSNIISSLIGADCGSRWEQMNREIHWGRRGKSTTRSETKCFCGSRAGRSCLNSGAQPWYRRYADERVMDSVLEKLQPKAVKAQGNSVGPVEAKMGKRNLQFAVWTLVQYFNKIISKTRHIGRVECGN